MNPDPSRPRRAPVTALVAVLSLLALPSCGDDGGRVKRYPASGKIRIDGKGAAGIRIRLHPTDRLGDMDALQPSGVTDGEGVYRLGTYEEDDGAPAGRYKATLFWPDSTDPMSRPKDQFKGAYARPESSPFELSIAEGDNELAAVEATKSGPPQKARPSSRRKAARDVGPGPDGPGSR